MDEIRIDGLNVYAYHGVYPEENEKGQNFYINAILYTHTRKAGTLDDLSFSTNYGEVCAFIDTFMKQNTYKLIETVAEKLAEEILLNYNLIEAISLEIRKPEAPVGLPFESVSVKIYRKWSDVYLSVGSNIGDKQKYIEDGVKALDSFRDIKVIECSDLLVTKPYGGVEQDDFLNGAIYIRTLLSPEELLGRLHSIEEMANRERIVRWGPRTLDLDIVFYDKLVYESNELIIPHVDLENRYFVLKPLSEIIPNYRHPLLGKTISQLLDSLGR